MALWADSDKHIKKKSSSLFFFLYFFLSLFFVFAEDSVRKILGDGWNISMKKKGRKKTLFIFFFFFLKRCKNIQIDLYTDEFKQKRFIIWNLSQKFLTTEKGDRKCGDL